jgi:hypothetical protein
MTASIWELDTCVLKNDEDEGVRSAEVNEPGMIRMSN